MQLPLGPAEMLLQRQLDRVYGSPLPLLPMLRVRHMNMSRRSSPSPPSPGSSSLFGVSLPFWCFCPKIVGKGQRLTLTHKCCLGISTEGSAPSLYILSSYHVRHSHHECFRVQIPKRISDIPDPWITGRTAGNKLSNSPALSLNEQVPQAQSQAGDRHQPQ